MNKSETRQQKATRIRQLIESEGDAIYENTTHINEGRYEAIDASPNHDELRDQARAIKEDAIERLPTLIETVREAVEANGGTVYLAEDGADANRYINDVLDDNAAESVVKSKSMTTEEIELNEALAADDIDVWETDLGEFVIQVAEESPSHIVGPSLHKSREEITDLFESHFNPDEPLDSAEKLTQFARDFLGERIDEADVGITGANFVAAESGTIALITNEGNARKCAAVPDTHVAVAGIEKIVPDLMALQPFSELVARSATGQSISQYFSLLSPPTDSPTLAFDSASDAALSETKSEREFHLVLLDNGRMEMRDDEHLRETLYCVRCGACANSCANFQHVGGHAFGGETYTGGIATGWEAGVYGNETAAEFNDLCTGCSRCVNACPVKIDIPWINTVVRDRINRGAAPEAFDMLVDGLFPDEEPSGVDLQKRFFGNFETLARLGSATAPLSNLLAKPRPVRALLESTVGIDHRRDLPAFERTTLKKWFDDREVTVTDPERKVVLYPDVYTNYVQTARGRAAVRVLEALGCRVEIPDCNGSGRAPLSQGMVETATTKAHDVTDALASYLDRGYDVAVVEPSALAMFRSEYENLLDREDYEPLAARSYDVMEYVYGMLENGADETRLGYAPGTKLAYHSHCQQRTLGVDVYTETVLERLGYDLLTSDVECCGMAGSFGYKSEYYDLSTDVGATLCEQFDDEDERTIVASGTSCIEQLDALLAPGTKHPIELLDPRSDG